jgi:hypothetical protein
MSEGNGVCGTVYGFEFERGVNAVALSWSLALHYRRKEGAGQKTPPVLVFSFSRL